MPSLGEKTEHYSFTKLSLWNECKYSYYLQYILGEKGETNAFAEYGILVHEILEKYARGELKLWTLPDIFDFRYDTALTKTFPRLGTTDLRTRYREQGMQFFSTFEGYGDDAPEDRRLQVLSAEQKFLVPVRDWALSGVVDVTLKDESNGNLIIRDYKSKAGFKSDKEKKAYARQLYLYSIYTNSQYGRYPDELQFLMFRTGEVVRIPFDQKDLEEAIEWADNTVKEIRSAFSYPPKKEVCNDFFANQLCDHRFKCPANPQASHSRL